MQKNKSTFFLILLLIFTMPYMNFPFFSSGSLKPLSIIPLFLFSLVFIKSYINKKTFIFFIFLVAYDFFITYITPQDILNNKPLRYQYLGFLQFTVFGFFSYISYYIGKNIISKYFSENFLCKMILLAYYPSLIFGLIHVVAVNLGMENPIFAIRSFFASAEFPSDYYRNIMLTMEPSFAAIDLMLIIVPISIVYFLKKKTFFSLFTLLIAIINLFGTLSGLAYFLMLISILLFIFYRVNSVKRVLLYSFPILIALFLVINTSSYINERATKIIANYNSGKILEESLATRYVSFILLSGILPDNVFGVGYSNEGYYYSKYIPEEYLVLPLIKDWADSGSSRFPDMKATLNKIIVAFGIIGAIIVVRFLFFFKKMFSSTKNLVIKMFILNGLIASLSVSFIGYFPILILFGYYVGLVKKENE